MMLVELSDAEAREVCLILRYVYDGSEGIPKCTSEALQIYINVVTKLQDALGIADTPWAKPELYEPKGSEG